MSLKYKVLFISTLTVLASCGDQHKGKSRAPAATGQSFTSEIKTLDANSLSIAYRVCNSFRSKRNYWHMNSIIGKKANLSVTSKQCGTTISNSNSLETVISASNLSAQIIFASLSSLDYKKDVETDQHGLIAQSCKTVLSGNNTINFYSYQKTQRVYTEFLQIADHVDRVDIKFAAPEFDDKNELTGYTSYKVVSFEVKTSEDPNDAIDASQEEIYLGTVTKATEVEDCESGGNSSFVQTLDSIL
ncbi:hypothetical protein [Halobacteriovorax sp. HLS]|uniref:hypothetical protein n=1 Tax=Halobacteriovorax sp. HLS TaxID=2234000 RepID=UPI000FDA9BEC|nr:hypothetical protein [Halobacteriovorax sp. HLS]